jgi:glutamine amidotransferase
MIGILNYGSGNLKSLSNSLNYLGIKYKIVKNKKSLKKISKLIIPGVGSYKNAMNKIERNELIDEIKNFSKKKIILGICLGMQILSEDGHEDEYTHGLKLISGSVKKIDNKIITPHVGWNNIIFNKKSILFKSIPNNCDFYFVHSYNFYTQKKNISSYTLFNNQKITASVESRNIFGVQFHPEKSHKNGLKILENFYKI